MEPKQKNWVFLACMLMVALFSVVVVFRNVRYQGRYAGQAPSATNVQDIMTEIEISRRALESAIRSGPSARSEVYARAGKISALLDELVKEAPENPTADRIGEWDRLSTKAVYAATRLADIAGDPAANWGDAAPAYGTLKRSCFDCHERFRKE